MNQKWNSAENIDTAKQVKVFSGGACNIRDGNGNLLRNQERDKINVWLTKRNVLFFDPQIHPDTHGIEYDYQVHHPMELVARDAAEINLFEVSPRTFSGVTSIEIAIEEFRKAKPTIIFFSDGNNDRDFMPAHSPDGFPLFIPHGIRDSDVARHAHYNELVKNANRMRQYLMLFTEQLDALTVTFNQQSYEGDIIITPYRVHGAELFQAVINASSGKRTNVNCIGGDAARDERGNPRLLAPENPREMDLRSYVDQYVDEGNLLRRAICELVHINVLMRVVFTQDAAINALDNLLRYKGLITA